MGRGQARLAGTYDNDVVLAGVCEVGNGLGSLQEGGQPASAEPVSASVAVSAAVFGAQPARALAPTTPAAAQSR